MDRLRRQRAFHSEFDPTWHTYKTKAALKGIYTPNTKPDYQDGDQYLHEFSRKHGNFKNGEPKPPPLLDDIKHSFERRPKIPAKTNEEIKKVEEERAFYNCAREVLRKNREKNPKFSDDEGTVGCEMMPFQVYQRVAELLDEAEFKLVPTAGPSGVARRKWLEGLFDEGWAAEVPEKFKWHPSQRNHPNFVNNLNSLNMKLLQQSLAQLTVPRDQPKARTLSPSPPEEAKVEEASAVLPSALTSAAISKPEDQTLELR